MKNIVFLAILMTALTGCSDDPATNVAQDTDTAAEGAQNQIKTRQNSIEEAAEQATKIIEADSKTEIDSFGETNKGP